ncbi:DUF4328 domain-containing protein [Streptomyces sparsogenes]|uniref:DUF4328 domain-containing protein n=1 Tax=Streptomyces sparsogenes TaxID=67365 RepID=UPI0033D78C47
MYPCGNCRAAAVGPDGRCAACGTYQQQLQQPPPPQPQPHVPPQQAPMPAAPPSPLAYPSAPPLGMPTGGVDLRRGLSTALVVLLGVTVAALILAFVGRAGQYSVYSDIADGATVTGKTIDEANDADDFAVVTFYLSTAVMIAVTVVWPIWFRRLRLNAEVYAPGQHRFGSGWAAGSWFTPVVQLWFPKQIANDIWRASSPQGPQNVRRGLLNGWWVTWIVGIVMFLAGLVEFGKANGKAHDEGLSEFNGHIDDMASGLAMIMFAYLVTIAAAILALLLVRQITAMQEQRASLPPQLGGGAPYGTPTAPYGAPPPYGPPGPAGPADQPYPPYGHG